MRRRRTTDPGRPVGMAMAVLAAAATLVWLSADGSSDEPAPAGMGGAATAAAGPPPAGNTAAGPDAAVRRAPPPPPAGLREAAEDRLLPPLARPPREGSERAYYESFLAVARADADGFRATCEVVLDGTASLAEKAAALRAWLDAGAEPRFWACEQALARPALEPQIRDLALRSLERASVRHRAARAVLASYLERRPDDVRGRYLAVDPVLRYGEADEVQACVGLLYGEPEPDVVVHAARALRESALPGAAAMLADLRHGHPRAEVRRALADDAPGG